MYRRILTSNSYTSIVVAIITLLSSLHITHCEYPVPPLVTGKLPAPVYSTGFAINETIYVYGGELEDTQFSNQFTKLSFDRYGEVHYENVNSNGPKVAFPKSVVLSSNDSVAIIGGRYDGYYPNITDPIRAQVYSFSQNTWTTLSGLEGAEPVPAHRQEHTAVKAANGLVYIHGGISSLNNFTVIRDNWSYEPTAGIFKKLTTPPIGLYGSTATALPDNSIVYVGGWYANDEMDPEFSDYFLFNQAAVYNPNGDSWKLQALNADAIGNPEVARVHSSVVLGPEGRYLYFVGGDNLGFAGVDDEYYNTLWILDTHTWIWSAPSVTGVQPRARTGSSIGRINNEYAVLCFGGSSTRYFRDIDALKFSDMTGNNSGSTKEKLLDLPVPKWVHNITTGVTFYEEITKVSKSRISKNAISAIGAVCGGLGCLTCIYIIYRSKRSIQRTKRIFHCLVVRPRAGEPLWAETTRLLSKLFLSLFFIAFFVFITIQVLESPETTYIFREPIPDSIPLPDIRFCLEGYTIGKSYEDGSTYPRMTCTTSDGELFDEHITPLRLSPLSEPHTDGTASIDIFFRVANTSETGRVYISFYHPKRDPNRNIYFAQHMPLFSDEEIGEWVLEDAFRASGDYLEPNEYAYVDYQFERTELLIGSVWNYFGFAPQYNSTPQVTTTFQKYGRPRFYGTMIGSISLSPASFTTIVHRGQRIYSLVNALGFVGGLYGLITAIQAAVFGYRPQSPFGVIHQWSFGHMKRSFYRGLMDRFREYKSPVPLVNPVHSRYESLLYNNIRRQETPEEQNENQDNNISNPAFSFDCNSSNSKPESSDERKQFAVLNVEENLTRCNSSCQHCIETIQDQARQIESIQERTQLFEHLFRSYYVDDDVFKKIDTAIKQPEKSTNKQHPSSSFLRWRCFKKLFERSRIHGGYHNTTSTDNIALVFNSSATNSNNSGTDMMQNNTIENEHQRNI